MSDYNQKPWYEKESEVGPERAAKRPLVEGALGEKLVDWFQANLGITPVEAECIYLNKGDDKGNYRITFDDESVADYLIIFDGPFSLEILNAEEYNRVI